MNYIRMGSFTSMPEPKLKAPHILQFSVNYHGEPSISTSTQQETSGAASLNAFPIDSRLSSGSPMIMVQIKLSPDPQS